MHCTVVSIPSTIKIQVQLVKRQKISNHLEFWHTVQQHTCSAHILPTPTARPFDCPRFDDIISFELRHMETSILVVTCTKHKKAVEVLNLPYLFRSVKPMCEWNIISMTQTIWWFWYIKNLVEQDKRQFIAHVALFSDIWRPKRIIEEGRRGIHVFL